MGDEAPRRRQSGGAAAPDEAGTFRSMAVYTTALAKTAADLPEYNMLELNGNITATWEGMLPTDTGKLAISHEAGAEPGYFDEATLGTFDVMIGKPCLVIGSHKLIGKVRRLPLSLFGRHRAADEGGSAG